MNYQKDVFIDETALDLEWLEQADLVLKYTRIEAACGREVTRCKEQLDIISAGIDKEIRKDPEKYDIDKVTENVIRNTILQDEEYLEANSILTDAVYEEKMAKGAVKAMDHRKTALENLVKLLGQQYFAGPKLPRNIVEQRAARGNKIDTSIKSKTGRTRTRRNRS